MDQPDNKPHITTPVGNAERAYSFAFDVVTGLLVGWLLKGERGDGVRGWSEKESMWKWLRPAPPSALSSSDDGGPCKGKRKQVRCSCL